MRPEEAVVVPLPVAPGAGLTLSPQELAAFAGLVAAGHQAALVLYLLELRPFVDGRTGVVGDARRVSEQAFIERLEVPASQGRSRSRPSRDFIQRQISALVSVGLLERLPKVAKRAPMRFFLPFAAMGSIRPQEVRTMPRTMPGTIRTSDSTDKTMPCVDQSEMPAHEPARKCAHHHYLEEEDGQILTHEQLLAVPLGMVVQCYHDELKGMPRVLHWDNPGYRLLVARVWYQDKRHREERFWRWYFAKVRESEFLKGRVPGRGGRTFQANFKFLVQLDTVIKVINGEYT